MGHKTTLSKFLKLKLLSVFLDKDRNKLEINNRNVSGDSTNMRWNKTLLNNTYF